MRTTYLWPGDTGWPALEVDEREGDFEDPTCEIDVDALCLAVPPPHLLDGLTPLERQVLGGRFGIGALPERSMKELHTDLGLTRHEVRNALETGLAKLRARLTA
jgi:hypothetical protein